MNTPLILVFVGELSGVPVQLVDARLLHSFLESKQHFSTWIKKRIADYGFMQDIDFSAQQKSGALESSTYGQDKIDYHLSIDMAKELGMIERNDKGRQIRRYFLDMERIAQSQYGLKQLPAPRAKRHVKGGLELLQQDAINDFIKERLQTVPQARQKAMALKIYSAINSKFGVTGTKDGYKNIAPEQFANIMQLISRISLEGDNLLVFTEADFNALVAEKFKAIEGELLSNNERPKYHAPKSDLHIANQIGQNAWLTYPQLKNQHCLAKLLRELKQDNHDVEGAIVEFNGMWLLLDSFYQNLQTLNGILKNFDKYGLNVHPL